ncbi:uncharacterized protein F5891DRAFT_1131908 [Suillus fuscotomentosus]|uniref:Uncharacterized protein n=1 Tax=Suillus fuscotomentosus TaxID=1912939 RepID=A0AAD4DPX8_9AGAM|nr:uncharacterized protein F5891DRAFT_1131908 [Suillus fuscotomentosus]KAG1889013.1 hypothetical protein F5891DRAFT_1131908 [Suillus fuscotomentosus]
MRLEISVRDLPKLKDGEYTTTVEGYRYEQQGAKQSLKDFATFSLCWQCSTLGSLAQAGESPHSSSDYEHWQPSFWAIHRRWQFYHPSSGYIFGKAPNTLKVMENDQYAYHRRHAPFYPFQDQAEFDLAKFLCERLMQSNMERFLKLEWVCRAGLSFSSKDQLLAWVASLPTRPKWCSTTLEMTGYPTIQLINLIWRDGLEVVQDLFANPIFANHMTYDPHVVGQLPEGATIVPMIVASDKTPVTRHTGGLEMHPIFVTITNIQSDVRMRATCHAWRCVAYMPIPKFVDVHPDYQTILSQHLFHKCMDIVFADTKVAAMVGKFMPDPAGHLRHCFTPLVAYTADLPEQQAIACVSKVASPITLATSQSFEFQEEAKAHSLSGIHQPFWQNWRHSDPSRFLVGEILHTCHKFFFDHPFKWCKESVGKDELDLRFRSHHKRVGTPHFSSGVCQMKQMTGWEHRDLQCTLVPSITGAQSPVYSDTSVDSMKHAILDAGARRGTKGTLDNFIIPKLELLQSFASFTKDTGALIQWTADVTERLLITHCKLPFERTSRQSHTFTEQIESMQRFQLYLFLRMHDSPLVNAIVTEEQEVTETDPALTWIARIAPNDPNQRCFVGPRPGILSSTTTAAFHVTITPDRAKIQFTTAWRNDRGRLKTWNNQVFPLGNCDAVITQSIHVNHIAQVRVVFQPIAPRHVTLPHYLADQPLLYVQYYEIVGDPGSQPAISMYTVARKYWEGPTGQWIRLGAVISLTDVTHVVELIPMYGQGADRTVGAATSMEVYECFYLNNFLDKEVYHSLHSDLH